MEQQPSSSSGTTTTAATATAKASPQKTVQVEDICQWVSILILAVNNGTNKLDKHILKFQINDLADPAKRENALLQLRYNFCACVTYFVEKSGIS